jgi:hypothetical protein
LHRDSEQGVVATAEPLAAIGGAQKRVDFGAVEERHVGSISPLCWYGKDALDEGGVFRVAERSEPEQRVDGGQLSVAMSKSSLVARKSPRGGE